MCALLDILNPLQVTPLSFNRLISPHNHFGSTTNPLPIIDNLSSLKIPDGIN